MPTGNTAAVLTGTAGQRARQRRLSTPRIEGARKPDGSPYGLWRPATPVAAARRSAAQCDACGVLDTPVPSPAARPVPRDPATCLHPIVRQYFACCRTTLLSPREMGRCPCIPRGLPLFRRFQEFHPAPPHSRHTRAHPDGAAGRTGHLVWPGARHRHRYHRPAAGERARGTDQRPVRLRLRHPNAPSGGF